MNRYINQLSLLLIALLLLVGCSEPNALSPADQSSDTSDPVRLTVRLSPADAESRAVIKDLNSKDVVFKWEQGNFDLNIAFVQGEVHKLVAGVEIKTADGESCTFDVEIPEGIDPYAPFDLYGVVAEQVRLRDGKLLVGVGAHSMYELTGRSSNRDGAVPVWFRTTGVTLDGGDVEATIEHLGALAVVTLRNDDTKPLSLAGVAMIPARDGDSFCLKAALPFEGNTELPYLNLFDLQQAPTSILTRVLYPHTVIAPGDVAYLGFWFRPDGASTPEVKLAAYETTARRAILSEETRPARVDALQVGKAYNVYAIWDGTLLSLQSDIVERELPAEQRYIRFTTDIPKGGQLPLIIGTVDAEAEKDVWIDLNDNGHRDMGEYVSEFSNQFKNEAVRYYTVESETITLYGDVSDFCYAGTDEGGLTSLDVTHNSELNQLFVYNSQIGTVDLSGLSRATRIGLEGCGLSTVTLPVDGSVIQELYLDSNELTEVDLTSAPNMLAFSVAGNAITKVKYPKFTTLWIADIQSNQMEAPVINELFAALNQAGQKLADWQYTAQIYDNPGAAKANVAAAKLKGWVIVSSTKSTVDGEIASPMMHRAVPLSLDRVRR